MNVLLTLLTVVAQQIGSENGNDLLAPDKKGDDPIALEQPGKDSLTWIP